MRYFITLSYDGTRYHGWQIQPNGDSIQQRLQEALSTLLRQPIEVVGAGRTDAGVHARMMVAHFTILNPQSSILNPQSSILNPQSSILNNLAYKLGKLLPPDIAVQDVRQVSDDMHARFSATSRTYHYYIHTQKDPFLAAYSWQVPFKLDFAKMNEAAQVLLEYKDFTSFSKVGTDVKTNLCDITEAYWSPVEIVNSLPPAPEATAEESLNSNCQWCFTITANRFLRNMVRAIVGTLVEVGRGRLDVDDVRRIIEAKDRCRAGESVPAKGLFLVDIKY